MLTQSELAKRSGIVRSHLYHIENESFVPSLRTLEKISVGLGVSLGRLLALSATPDLFVLENPFVQQVRPLLPFLNSQQRELLLRTLEAAPKNRRPL